MYEDIIAKTKAKPNPKSLPRNHEQSIDHAENWWSR